jgi:hypothetical protein
MRKIAKFHKRIYICTLRTGINGIAPTRDRPGRSAKKEKIRELRSLLRINDRSLLRINSRRSLSLILSGFA